MAVLATLRTLICMGVGLLVWYVLVLTFKGGQLSFGGLSSVLVPVWVGGLAGGVVACIFSTRQGVGMAFTSGVLLAIGFLWYRHMVVGMGLGENTMLTLWPVWFPPSYYVGAFGYLNILANRKK